jgi:hypothetical protein
MAHNQGFASLGAERRRQMSSKGGRAGHEQGTAHKYTTAEASAAGKKSAAARRARKLRDAALRLLKAGLSVEQIHSLPDDQVLKYGGPKADQMTLNELKHKLHSTSPTTQ